ncbi:MAG: acyl-CoA dehydrogenase [Gammaproteobacteria bacterium]|nr:acyl-CoA dehydrogenase [Gammaproteobacteria bacterium]
MDFEDSPEEASYREDVRKWLQANAEPLKHGESAPTIEEHDSLDVIREAQVWQAKKYDAGWACLSWPKKFGGRDAKGMQSVIWRQEEKRFKVPPDVFQCSIGMAGPTLMAHGTEDQLNRWLPPIARGDELFCQLFSEPGAGSDLSAVRTRAKKEGSDWIVDGHKIWTSLAQFAHWGILVTRTDFDVPKHAGLTYFIVDLSSTGIEIRPVKQITGGETFNEVFLSGVRIPDANRIGEVGNGWRVTLTTLANERGQIATGAAGKISISGLIELASDLKDDKGPLIEQDGVKEKIADLFIQSRGLRYTSLRTLSALSRGKRAGAEGSIGKLGAAIMRQEMSAFAIELQGLAGAIDDSNVGMAESAWQAGYLFSPAARIAGGTDEIQRDIIAERVLGLPREPRVDKKLPFRELPVGR